MPTAGRILTLIQTWRSKNQTGLNISAKFCHCTLQLLMEKITGKAHIFLGRAELHLNPLRMSALVLDLLARPL